MRCASFVICIVITAPVFSAAPANFAKSPAVILIAPKKLLFLPFYNEAANPNFAWFENSIGHSLHESARAKFKYDKIDDNDFSMYFINKGYSLSDLYNFEKITKIAHDLGVDGVIYGTFKAGPSTALRDHPSNKRPLSEGEATEAGTIVLTGKILSVIDREIIAEKTVTIPVSAEMFSGTEEISQALGENIAKLFYPSDTGALVRAATLPGWGHRYKQRPGWGYFWGGFFWTSVSFFAFSTFEFVRFSIAYHNYAPEHYTSPTGETGLKDPTGAQAQFDAYKQNITLWGEMTLGSFIGVALVYAGNLLHAYNIAPNIVATPDMTGSASLRQGPKLHLGFAAQPLMRNVGANEAVTQVSLVWKF